jgi:hypothetical protein
LRQITPKLFRLFLFVRSARQQIIFSDLTLDVVTIELADRAQFR